MGKGGVQTPHPVLKAVFLPPQCVSWGLPPWAQTFPAAFTPGAHRQQGPQKRGGEMLLPPQTSPAPSPIWGLGQGRCYPAMALAWCHCRVGSSKVREQCLKRG